MKTIYKKIIKAVILFSVIIFCAALLASCKNEKTVFEDFIKIIKSGELSRLDSVTTEESHISNSSAQDYMNSLSEEKKELYKKILGYIEFSYPEKEIENGILGIKFTYVDLNSLSENVSVQVSVFGKSACDVINEYISSGKFQNDYIKSARFNIKTQDNNGEISIPYTQNENPELWNALDIINFLRWFSNI